MSVTQFMQELNLRQQKLDAEAAIAAITPFDPFGIETDQTFDPLPRVPAILKSCPNWVTFESADNKAPIISGTHRNASSDDPATWVDYTTACQNIKTGKGYAGLGLVTDGKTNHLVGLDLDGCRNPATGELTDWAQRLLHFFDGSTYAEVTVSGTGLRIWVVADMSEKFTAMKKDKGIKFWMGEKPLYNFKNQKLEIFQDGLYFTMSGNRVDGCPSIVAKLDQKRVADFFTLVDQLKIKPDAPVSTNSSGDPGFKNLQDAVGMKPFLDRLNKHPDERLHGFDLEPGELNYCPMLSHGTRDVTFKKKPFGLMPNGVMLHCFGCDWSGDVIKACHEFDKAEYAGTGLIASVSMYETARSIAEENGLRFEDYFDAKTKVEATTQTGRTIKFVRGDSVKSTRIEWLWRGRILADKLNVFSGEPDVGKGMTMVDFAARITKHLDFPDCKNELDGPKDVLLLSSEDDMEDTIVPRLIAAGADMTRIHFAQISENTSGTKEEGIVCLDRDLPILEAEIRLNPDIVLIIPDPVIAFLGDADPNNDQEIRPIYSKMKTFAKRLNVAWLFVNHWNKNQNATSINKTSGAKTMVSAPRATWMFTRSPEDPARYLMMKGKGNLSSNRTKTLAYRIISVPFDFGDGRPADPDGVPKLVWDGETDHTCDEVLQDATEPKNRRSSKAEELLTKLLDSGARLATEIYIAGDKEGINADKMKRAKYQLGYETDKLDNRWYWAKSKEDLLKLKIRMFTPATEVSLEPAKVGRPTVGEQPMTSTERSRRMRQNQLPAETMAVPF